MNKFIAFVSGLLMGSGLLVSGMASPQKVLDFLNLALIFEGAWDPSLIFVMLGGLTITLFGFLFVRKTQIKPLISSQYYIPKKKKIDKKLIIGASLFGLGWGIVGVCPGTAIVALPSLDLSAFVTVTMMFIGLMVGKHLSLRF